MKLATLACPLLAATFAMAQTHPQPAPSPASSDQMAKGMAAAQDFAKRIPPGQPECPVVFTKISFQRAAYYLPVMQYHPGSSSGDLDFQYKNQSSKTILSISVSVELTAKRSLYDLDAIPVTIDMVLTGTRTAAPLPPLGYVYSVNHATLERVQYADGTVWSAGNQNVCRYNAQGGAEQIGKLW
jgi:hypothetical protein